MRVSEAFVTYFESQIVSKKTRLNLKDFLQNFFQHKTPVKSNLLYGLNQKQLVRQAKECILYNIYLNPYFLNIEFDLKYLQSVYDLFKQTNDTVNSDQIARIIFLLHFSKSILDDFEQFLEIIVGINSIVLVSNFEFSEKFNTIYEKVLSNSNLKQKIQKVVKMFLGFESNYSFESTKLNYFSSSYFGLHGFAGLDSLYVNVDTISMLYGHLCKDYSNDEKLAILKMNFVRVILHEVTHVALRFAKNDFNMSSPAERKTNTSASYAISEAGVMTEIEVFKGRINWKKTGEKKLDLQFCYDFLEKLESNSKPEFNVNLEDVVLRTDQIRTMAIDMNWETYDFSFN